jgi:hypothetical protein
LKYNKKGNVTDRIHLVAESATVLETSYDNVIERMFFLPFTVEGNSAINIEISLYKNSVFISILK